MRAGAPEPGRPGPIEQRCDSWQIISLAHRLDASHPVRDPGDFVHEFVRWHDAGRPDLLGQLPGSSAAVDRLEMQLHVGTHVDTALHISFEGRLHDGSPVAGAASRDREPSIGAPPVVLRPIVGPGLLIDLPTILSVRAVGADHVITAAFLDGWQRRTGVDPAGRTVLVRTGWDTHVGDPAVYLSDSVPGIDAGAARWLAQHGVAATGSDTYAFEAVPLGVPLEPHVELIARSGIPIVECLDLRQLARSGAKEFLFVLAPLPLAGATASPVNPLAIIPQP